MQFFWELVESLKLDAGDLITIGGVFVTAIFSFINLISTKRLQYAQQRANIVAAKRSERIDALREYSAEVISYGKCILAGLDVPDAKDNMIHAANQFIAYLQHAYKEDVTLIIALDKVVESCLCPSAELTELQQNLHEFYHECDFYVGVEYERLKHEATGKIGNAKQEERIFEKISEDQKKRKENLTTVRDLPYIPTNKKSPDPKPDLTPETCKAEQ